jgi:hypothetical protein
VYGGGSIGKVAAAGSVWLVVTLVALIHAAGGSVPHWLEVICAVLAAPVALAAAGQVAAGFWRGPVIHSFSPNDAEACTPDEASFIRLGAQLRGTMGGAGYLHPARLLFPALAWVATAVEGMLVVASGVEGWVFGALATIAVAGASATMLLPARAYYYRDATGGGALLSPPTTARRLKRLAALAQAVTTGKPADLPARTPAGALAGSRAAPPDAR